MYRILCN